MKWAEQGATGNGRYTVVPRSLIFITAGNDLLLLRGAPDKRIWPNRLNGIGGHLEADEDPVEGARREILEETGLTISDLALRGLIHVAGRAPDPGVLLLIFVAQAPTRCVNHSDEGTLEWHPLGALPYDEMVEDLPQLLPLLFDSATSNHLICGYYDADTEGTVHYRFQLL